LESELGELKQQLDTLTTNNKQLLAEIDVLSKQLHDSETKAAAEIQSVQDRLSVALSESEQLRAANQELQRKIADIKEELEASESRLSESAAGYRQTTERHSKLQAELFEVSQQLEASQATIAELQAAQQQLAGIRMENQQLREEIADCRDQLERTEMRLRESAGQAREAADRYAQLESEVADLAREAQESRETIFKDQQQKLEAQVAELQRELAAKLEEPTKHAAPESASETGIESMPRSTEPTIAYHAQDNSLEGVSVNPSSNGDVANVGKPVSPSEPAVVKKDQTEQVARSFRNRRWRLALLPANIAVLVMIIVMDLPGTGSDRPSGSRQPTAVAQSQSYEQWVASEAEPSAHQGSAALPVSASTETEFSPQTSAAKPARLQGIFKVTRPTQVYSRPSEASSRIASVGPGMTINVVDSREGWLEIRSKHGRPPGFIRQEAAVRVGQK
jgi:myosin heavy subunit